MVGESMAELLTGEFHSIDDLLAAPKEQIARIKLTGAANAEWQCGPNEIEQSEDRKKDKLSRGYNRVAVPAWLKVLQTSFR